MSERIPQPQVAPPEPEAANRGEPQETIEAKKPPESQEAIFENLRETRENLLHGKSQKAAEVAGLYLQGKLTQVEARNKVEKIPDREKLVGRRGGGTEPLPFFQSRETKNLAGLEEG